MRKVTVKCNFVNHEKERKETVKKIDRYLNGLCVSCIDETRANIMLQIWKEKGKKLPGEKKKKKKTFLNQVVKKVNKKVNAAQG